MFAPNKKNKIQSNSLFNSTATLGEELVYYLNLYDRRGYKLHPFVLAQLELDVKQAYKEGRYFECMYELPLLAKKYKSILNQKKRDDLRQEKINIEIKKEINKKPKKEPSLFWKPKIKPIEERKKEPKQPKELKPRDYYRERIYAWKRTYEKTNPKIDFQQAEILYLRKKEEKGPSLKSIYDKKREEKKQIREKFKIIEQINDSPFILLDVISNIISRFKHINEVANYINEHPQTIRNAVKRKTIIQKKYIAIFNDINKK